MFPDQCKPFLLISLLKFSIQLQLESDTEPSDTQVRQGTPRESFLPPRSLKMDFNLVSSTLPKVWLLELWAEKPAIG